MPVARPMEAGEGDAATASYHVKAGEGDIEDTIVTVHPSVARQSPFCLLVVVLAMALGVAGILFGTVLAGMFAAGVPGAVLWIGGLIILAGASLYLLVWWIQSRFTELIVTDHRTTLRTGLISRSTTEIGHEDVRNLQVDQSIPDRLLGVGTLSISSAGQDTMEIVVHGIPEPEKVAAIIRDMQ